MKHNKLHPRMAVLMVAILSIGSIITSCLDDDYYFEQAKKYYNKQWLKLIGPIPVEHDWSVAQQINATFDIAQEAEGEQTVRIYTHHPLDERCRLLARTTINGTGEVKFDMLKGHKDVYVRVTNAHQEITFEGYFMLEGTKLAVTPQTIATRLQSRLINDSRVWAENCTIELADARRDGLNEYRELNGSIGESVDMMHMHYFENNQHYERVCMNFIDDIYPIIHDANNQTAIFQEQKDNRAKATQGVEYITIGNTEIALTYMFGATGFYNSFGYFYWDPSKGETYKDAHKIILMNDARPQNNIRYANNVTTWDEATAFYRGSEFSDMIISTENPLKPNYIVGTKYKLVYYGENYDQEPTYTFPKGIHIGFFIFNNYYRKGNSYYAYNIDDSPLDMSNNDSYHKNLVFSLPEYNADIKEYYNYRILEEKKDTITGMQGIGEISAVTYSYRGHTILGFEDGIDKDMNDILLLVDANVQTNEGVIEDIEEESFIIACEDLGNTGDYDFNDVVFKVSHVGGSDKLNIIPLASGGTLPVELHYNQQNIATFRPNGSDSDDDFHKLINPEATMKENSFNPYKPLNVRKGETILPGDTITLTVPTDYTINKNQFTVEVKKGYGTSLYIEQGSIYIEENMKDSAHNKAPQMMILPGNWNWPTEGTLILDAYPDFGGWTRNEEASAFWYNNRNAEHLVDYTSTEGENGGGTGGGEIETPQEPDYVPVNIPVTGINNQQTTLTTQKHATHYNEVIYIPESYFSTQGSIITIVAMQGVNQTVSAGINNAYSLGLSDNGTLVGSISANDLRNYATNGTVPLHFWCDAANIASITIAPMEYVIFDNYEEGQKYGHWGENTYSFTIETDTEGNQVLHYYNSTDHGLGNAYYVELVYSNLSGKVTSGKTYMLSLRIKGSTADSFSGGFRTSNSTNTGDLTVPVTTEWQTIDIPVTCTGSDTDRLLFDLGRYAGDIWFDDLTLVELGTETTVLTMDNYSELASWGNNSSRSNADIYTITNPSGTQTSNYWDAQLKFGPTVQFVNGQTYTLRMNVTGTTSGNVSTLLQIDSSNDNASDRSNLSITGNGTQQQIEASMTCTLDGADVIMMDIGYYTGTLQIENIQLTLPDGSTQAMNVASVFGTDASPRQLSTESVLSFTNPSVTDNANAVQMRYKAQSSFVEGQFYKLTLDIKGSKSGTIQTFLQKIVGSGNSAQYTDGETKDIPVGTGDYQTVTVYMKCTSEGAQYLLFNVGKYDGTLYIDNLKLSTFQ